MLTVLAILLVVGLVPLALMGWQVGRSLGNDLEANQKETQLDKAKTIDEEITRYVDGHFERLETIATAIAHLSVPTVGARRTISGDTSYRQLLDAYVGRPGVLELRLLLTDSEGAREVAVHSEKFDPAAIDDELRPLMVEARATGLRGSRYLSNPFLPASRSVPHALAVLAVPLEPLAEGEERPVLVAIVSMERIQQLVQSVGDTNLGYTVYVLDDEGRPFAHTRFADAVAHVDMGEHELVKRARASGLAAFTVAYPEKVGGSSIAMIGTYHPVQLEPRHWGVFIEVERSVGLFQVHDLWRNTFRWGLAAFALAVIIGIVFSWRLTTPIHALIESTRRVASGDYARRVRLKGNDELGMLADNFNVMAEEIGKTIDDLRLQKEQNDQLFLSSIRSLSAAIDARDPYTRGHSERVTRYARIIARQLGLQPAEIRNVEIGALLHDVGKIGIEDRILRKPAALTPEEFEIMKTHPEKGGAIMEPIAVLRDAAEIIIHHHERWDGGGYPSGLKADEIPIGARVVNVADTFDAMTTNRPYQRAMTFQVAARKIGEFSGKACDPEVVRAFTRAFEAGLLAQMESATHAS